MTWWCCHTRVRPSARPSSLTFTTRPSSSLHFVVVLAPLFFFLSQNASTHSCLHLSQTCVCLFLVTPSYLSAHLPVCLSVCLFAPHCVFGSLRECCNWSLQIGPWSNPKRSVSGLFGDRLGFKDMAWSQARYISAVCHPGHICPRAVGISFND